MDRDFLFGVIAVQLGQATPQQIMAAASAYVADKSKAIPDRLVLDGVLTEERRLMLDTMVADALEVHGGDVNITVETLGGDRAVYASFGGSVVVDEKGEVSIAPEVEFDGDTMSNLTAVTHEAKGRYKLEGDAEIGRGGIGRILVAFDEHLGREIAVKELLVERTGSMPSTPQSGAISKTSAIAARFLREARVTGQLEHPSIMPVYEVGQRENGTFYYTMKLVRGRTLADALKECSTLDDRLKLLAHYEDLCHAIAYAHNRGVIHRDIKPENVMVGEFGETVVLDWGLAKVKGKADIRGGDMERDVKLLHDEGTGKTVDGAAIGTPAYMSPEQADGAIEEIDERSDVWNLGAVLYEILTGKPPFQGVTPYEIIGKVIKDPVKAPREVESAIRPELAAVAEKALRRDKDVRYDSASKVALEIEAYRSGTRVSAYEYTSWELLKGFVARNKVATASALIIIVLIIGSGIGLFRAYQEANVERMRAEQNETRARESEQEAHFNLAVGLREKARLQLEKGNTLGARIFAAASLLNNPFNPRSPYHPEDDPFDHPRAHEEFVDAYSIHQQATVSTVARPEATLRHNGSVESVAYSPDGETIATGGEEGKIFLWDATKAQLRRTIEEPGTKVSRLALSADGVLLASGYDDGSVRLWSAKSFELVETFRWHEEPVKALVFSPNSKALASGSPVGRTLVWELEGRRLHELSGSTAARVYAAYSPKTGSLALREDVHGNSISLFDSVSYTRTTTIDLGGIAAYDVDLSADGRWLVAVQLDNGVHLWDLESSVNRVVFQGHTEQIYAVSFVPDTTMLVSAGMDETVRLWSTESMSGVQVLEGHTEGINDVAAAPDGRHLASASSDGTVRLWSLRASGEGPSIGAGGRSWFVDVSPDGTMLATTGKQPGILDIASRTLIRSFGEFNSVGVAFSPDGSELALGGRDKTVRLYNVTTGEHRVMSGILQRYVRHVDFSPDGGSVASGCWAGVKVFDVESGDEKYGVDGVGGVSFSPDGKLLATGGADQLVKLWDARNGELLRALEGHVARIDDVTFSHDGRWLASTGFDGSLLLWDMERMEKASKLVGHHRWINSVRFSRDDELISTGADDWSVRVWSVESQKTVMIIRTPYQVVGTDFLIDGRTLAIQYGDDVILYPIELSVGDADPVQLLRDAEEEAGMRLEGFSLVPVGD